VRKELIRPHRSSVFATDDAYRFLHQLVRDAAYEAIPKELRAELHERFASWLEHRLSEYDEIVGYHLEQAYRYLSELGDPDEHARDLGRRAGDLLGAAGLRAADRYDIPSTINLLTRAVDLLPAQDPRRLELLVSLGAAHQDANAIEQAAACFDEAFVRATEADLHVVRSRATMGRLDLVVMGGGRNSEALPRIEHEITRLKELDDPLGLAGAYREAGKVEAFVGHTERADRLFHEAIANARRVGSGRIESEVLAWRLAMQCHGYLPAGEGLRSTDAILQEGRGGLIEAFACLAHSFYRTCRGDLEASRTEAERARTLLRELGADFYVASYGVMRGHVELAVGEAALAEAVLRQSYDILEQPGIGGVLSTVAGMLARALVDQGQLAEAERLTETSERLGAADDLVTQIEWRSTSARVLARRGDVAGGEALAREAVALAEDTDFLIDHAHACLDLAEVLSLAGRAEEGRPAIEQAIRLFERKEIVIAAERARARLRALAREPLAERD
jgi:tetratricopeptide (TPR) repeat protein